MPLLRLRRPWTRQPQRAVRIAGNAYLPIRFAMPLHGSFPLYEASNSGIIATPQNGVASAVSKSGIFYTANASSSRYLSLSKSPFLDVDTPCSILFTFRLDLTTQYPSIFTSLPPGATNRFVLGWSSNTSYDLYVGIADSSYPMQIDVAQPAVGTERTVCIILKGGLNSATASDYVAFVNGTRYEASGPSATYTAQTGNLNYLGWDGANAKHTGPLGNFIIFHGALPESKAMDLSLNPWQIFEPDTLDLWIPAAGGGSQDLTPALFSDGDTFYTATVSAGAVALTPSLFTDGDTFYAATVAAGAVTLTPSLLVDDDTFYAASVAVEGGPQTLTPDLFTDGDTFHAATVTPGAVNLAPTLYTDADTFHAATVSAGFSLQPAVYVDPDTFYTATVTTGAVTLTPALFTDGDTFYSATVANAGVQTLEPGLLIDADTFYIPVVTGGTRTNGAARSAGRQMQTGARTNIQTNRRH